MQLIGNLADDPRRNSSTQMTKITPWITITHWPTCARLYCMAMMMKAPATGPNTVPSPPTSAISTTSPDIGQSTSVSEAICSTIALVEPARPGKRRREHEGHQLVAVGLVAERNRARLVLADRLQHLAERRMDDAVDQQEAGREK